MLKLFPKCSTLELMLRLRIYFDGFVGKPFILGCNVSYIGVRTV